MNDQNFATKAEIFNYALKLNKLVDDEIFFLAVALDAETSDNKNSNIKNIISKLKSLSSDEGGDSKRFIDDYFNDKGISKRELAEPVKTEEVSQITPLLDKIFCIFSPKVDLETKAFCCFPIKTTNIIYSILATIILIFVILHRYFYLRQEFKIYFIVWAILHMLGTFFLYKSCRNNKYSYAKSSLLFFEFKYICHLLINFVLKKKLKNNSFLVAFIWNIIDDYENNEQSLNVLFLYLLCFSIIIILEFTPIYLAYLQVSITRIKQFMTIEKNE